MLEKNLNTIIVNSITSYGGTAFKIPDSGQYIDGIVTHGKNPFDIMGAIPNYFICIESKYLQSPKAFNFNKLQDHQIDNLIKYYELLKPNVISIFLVGVNYGRGDNRVYIWKNEDLYTIRERRINKQNILKKEFDKRNNYIKISKGEVNLEEVFNLPPDKFE